MPDLAKDSRDGCAQITGVIFAPALSWKSWLACFGKRGGCLACSGPRCSGTRSEVRRPTTKAGTGTSPICAVGRSGPGCSRPNCSRAKLSPGAAWWSWYEGPRRCCQLVTTRSASGRRSAVWRRGVGQATPSIANRCASVTPLAHWGSRWGRVFRRALGSLEPLPGRDSRSIGAGEFGAPQCVFQRQWVDKRPQ